MGVYTLQRGEGRHFCRGQVQIDSWWMVVKLMEFALDRIILLSEIGSSFVYQKILGHGKGRLSPFKCNTHLGFGSVLSWLN